MEINETGVCCLCGGTYTCNGNNPWPLESDEYACCDRCNREKVIPARLLLMGENEP